MNDRSSRALLERLIGFATVSRDSNLDMIEFIRLYLQELDVESELFYKVSDYYVPECEGGLRFDDPDIGIDWPYPPSRMILSEKDKTLPLLRDFDSPFAYESSPPRPHEA